MAMSDVVNLIVSNGLAVVIIAYFIVKDWKTATAQLDLMRQINELMGRVEGVLQTLSKKL